MHLWKINRQSFTFMASLALVFSFSTWIQAQPVPEEKPPVTSKVGEANPPPANQETLDPPPPKIPTDAIPFAGGVYKPTGLVELGYTWSFNKPSNMRTGYRGVDDNHHTFTLEQLFFGGQWEKDRLTMRIVINVIHTPNTFKNIQEGYFAYKAPVGPHGLTFSGGIFLSPTGIERGPVRAPGNWLWTRGFNFALLPTYFVGARAKYNLTKELAFWVAGYNGWSTIGENNEGKTLSSGFTYESERYNASLLYLGGPERATGSPEGQHWRHMVDFWGTAKVVERVKLGLFANAGTEKNNFGTGSWQTFGVLSQVIIVDKYFFWSTRAEYLREHRRTNAAGTKAAPVLIPGDYLGSIATALVLNPQPNFSIRLEYRHDQSQADFFFKGEVPKDGKTPPGDLPNAKQQNTVTLGATAFF